MSEVEQTTGSRKVVKKKNNGKSESHYVDKSSNHIYFHMQIQYSPVTPTVTSLIHRLRGFSAVPRAPYTFLFFSYACLLCSLISVVCMLITIC